MKTCSKCGETKRKEDFYSHQKAPDGLRSHCKSCSKALVAKYARDNKEWRNGCYKRYYEKNKEKYIVSARTRDGKVKMASFDHEKGEIKRFYARTPEGHHVDHIVPLTHPLVCGLHVLANLQYLPARENDSKGNKFEI